MLTLVGSMFIEGYTVFQDDENDIEALQSRIDTVLAGEQKRAQALVDALRGLSGQSTDSLDGINQDNSFASLANQPPPAPAAPPANQVVTARRFYVLPNRPEIATDDGTPNGKPIFSLVVYRRADDRLDPSRVPTDDVGGGILTFTVELSVPQDAIDRITRKLMALVNGSSDSPAQVQVTPVQFIEGKVSIAVAAEGPDTPGNQFVGAAVGTGDVVGVADNRKAVMVKLTQDGAALMSDLTKLRTLPINVQYQLAYEHRLLGVTLQVWCDVSSSYQLIQTTYHQTSSESSGYLGLSTDNTTTDKVAKATEVMTRNKTCGVLVIPSTSAIDQDTLTALAKFGEDMLQKELEKVVTANPVPQDIDRSWLDKWGSDASNTLNFRLDEHMVLQQKYTPSANIQNIFTRDDIANMVTFVDLTNPFFVLLKVPIRVNADFTKLPISHVVVTATYNSRSLDGSTTVRTESFDFTDGSAIQTFIAYADRLDTVAYDWSAEVHYQNIGGGTSDTYTFSRSRVKDRFLIVDVGTLGMIAADFALGLVDTDKFPKATVSVYYQSSSGKQLGAEQFTLDKDNPEYLWKAIIKEESTGVYFYKVDWYSKADGRIIPGSWQQSSDVKGSIDAPIVDHMDISVVCSGNFKDGDDPISHVLVSLVYDDPAHSVHTHGSLDFTDDKQRQLWGVDLADSNHRDYQYRYTVIYKGGVVQQFPPDETKFFPGQPGFIVVGPTYDLEVNVYPYLLQLAGFPDQERMVQVDLNYRSDDGKINTTGTFNFTKEKSDPQVWRASTGGQGPQPYSVMVTYYSGEGQITKAPAQLATGKAYVVPPLPALTTTPH
jgi:hypothetical protein